MDKNYICIAKRCKHIGTTYTISSKENIRRKAKDMERAIDKRKLLIVDDNQASRILLIEVLANLDLAIIETGYAKEALSLYSRYSNEIVLVVLDMRLPICDGCELLNRFRSINPFLPAIAISALEPKELAVKSKEAGFDAYASKPFDIEVFLRMVKGFLQC